MKELELHVKDALDSQIKIVWSKGDNWIGKFILLDGVEHTIEIKKNYNS